MDVCCIKDTDESIIVLEPDTLVPVTITEETFSFTDSDDTVEFVDTEENVTVTETENESLTVEDSIDKVEPQFSDVFFNEITKEVSVVNEYITNISENDVPYEKLRDFIDATIEGEPDIFYKGDAAPGSLKTDPVWRISKTIIDAADGDIQEKWANQSEAFDKIWDNTDGSDPELLTYKTYNYIY